MSKLCMDKDFTYDKYMEFLKNIGERYGVYSVSIGHSVLGRNIEMIRIGTGGEKRLYVGAHHACEYVTAWVLSNFISEYLEKRQRGYKYIRELEEKVSIFAVPLLNPDGVEMRRCGADKDCLLYDRQIKMNGGNRDFSRWQANARGVDLNHNYNAGFWEYKELEKERGIEPGATKYSGRYPESEPEVRSICTVLRSVDISAIVTLHSQGEEIYYTGMGDYPKVSEKIAKRMAKLSGYKLSVPTDTASFGGLTDYAASILKIPSFTLECGLGENPLPISDFDSIYKKVRKVLFMKPYVRR